MKPHYLVIRKFFAEYCDLQWTLGYQEGISGKEYSGRTFIGYHGYVAGRRNAK